jgi:hypothetical protein
MYCFEYPLYVLQHIAVPESEHPIAARLEPSRPRLIIGDVLAMLTAVELDQQAMRQAREIDDVRADRHLPSKTIAPHLTIAKLPPKLALGVR